MVIADVKTIFYFYLTRSSLNFLLAFFQELGKEAVDLWYAERRVLTTFLILNIEMLYYNYISGHAIFIDMKYNDQSLIGSENIRNFINYAIFNFLIFLILNLNKS